MRITQLAAVARELHPPVALVPARSSRLAVERLLARQLHAGQAVAGGDPKALGRRRDCVCNQVPITLTV